MRLPAQKGFKEESQFWHSHCFRLMALVILEKLIKRYVLSALYDKKNRTSKEFNKRKTIFLIVAEFIMN